MNNIKDFKTCEKGHFYPKDKENCPYCPKGSSAGNDDKTKAVPKTEKTPDSTINKTLVFDETNIKEGHGSEKKTKKFDPNKTMIAGTTIDREDDDSPSNKINRRKLRGWLVTFDLEGMAHGVDFKIEEGRTTIGRSSTCDITIEDSDVSSEHTVILCKRDKFMMEDLLSSNGTFLNGEDLTPKKVYDLNDGDEIKVGKITLLFRKSFK